MALPLIVCSGIMSTDKGTAQ